MRPNETQIDLTAANRICHNDRVAQEALRCLLSHEGLGVAEWGDDQIELVSTLLCAGYKMQVTPRPNWSGVEWDVWFRVVGYDPAFGALYEAIEDHWDESGRGEAGLCAQAVFILGKLEDFESLSPKETEVAVALARSGVQVEDLYTAVRACTS